MVEYLIPLYVKEGKNQLVINIGCTGGKHRSVTFAVKMHEHLENNGFKVQKFHRDLPKYLN